MENIQEVLYLGILIFTVTSYGQEDCECPAVVYLQFGDKGTIPCRCDHFSLVSWYSSKENYDDGSFPFIRYDNSETKGTGKVSGQFDLEPDGTLIINNVSMINHEMEYFSVFLRDTEGQTVSNSVKVEVIVSPDPLYPVLNGHMNHQYLYLDMKREGTLYCSMKGVHPKVNLSITVIDQGQQGGVDLQRGDTMYSSNEDHSYDVKVTYNYTTDLSVQMSILQCNVTGELGQHFSEVTTAEISFPPGEKAFLVIDGGINPEHIYLEKNRTGEIVCSIRTSDPDTKLIWKVVDPFSEDKILFENCFLRALPRGGTFIVSLKCSYVVEDEDVDRVTVQCLVTDSTDEQYQNATKVELLFPKKAQSPPAPTSLTPVIDGCDGKHDICTLKVQSEGELTCRVENSHQLVELRWNIFDGHQWQVSSGKMEVARDVISTFQYEVKKSQAILIAECYTVVGDRIPEASSKVVLVTEADGDSDNKSGHGVRVGLIVFSFIVLFVISWLIGFMLWCSNRKMFKSCLVEVFKLSDSITQPAS
ncbi:hypothetical protein HOLleu_42329 [Holothuria leucospilota]|uniref:Ig-like domain-containing protein n=1 Tax=Holothuria leucospilota TaxID=206669 RepID=A0A9Q0YBR6_HOLLE|nr:hypothetical protein HOLleu_42329 [Holothuria leucospilota]